MTGKRYKSIGANLKCSNGQEYMLVKRDDGFNVCQVCSKHTAKEIVDELNSLAEENEELKQNCKNYEWYKAYKELLNENEQLKQQLKKYTDAFDCSSCRYQNYDWFDDGDEFEVCDKGNNEAQMDNHSCNEWEEL